MKALHSFVLSYSAPNRKSILKKTDFQGKNIFSLNVTEDIASVLVTAHALQMALAFSHYIWHSDRVTTSHKVEDMQGYNAVNPRLWISIKLRKPRNPEVLLMKTMTMRLKWDSNVNWHFPQTVYRIKSMKPFRQKANERMRITFRKLQTVNLRRRSN